MTTAPENLKAARALMLAHLDIHPGTVSADLDPAEVGIVGDSAHRGGYHCGSDRCDFDDYSVRESPRDQAGLSLYASALDIGSFSVTVNGQTHNLKTFSVWLAGECAKGAADCADIREVIYSPDGKIVKRFDRLGKRSSGDSSHLWHTHISYFRDATKAGRDLGMVFRRYLVAIGLLIAEPGTTPPPPPPPAPAPKPAVEKLTVDGDLGARTIKRWQQIMGTPADGQITEPSELVKAVQRHLNAKIGAGLGVDGKGIRQDGRKYRTVAALQRYLHTEVDGIMSRPKSEVVKALQRRLNEGRF